MAIAFTRLFFMMLSILFVTVYAASNSWTLVNLGIGILSGALFGCTLIGCDLLFKRCSLRSFNTVALGLLFGYLMGQASVLVFSAILEISSASLFLSPESIRILKICLFLLSLHLGALMAMRASDELHLSIPFIRFNAVASKKKDLVLDLSALHDVRMVDLASSGILDRRLIFPRFILKELLEQAEAPDESIRIKAKRALDVIKRLEGLSELGILYNDTDFPDAKDGFTKTIRLARLIDANILMADPSQIKTPPIENLRLVNIHELSKALKPIMHTGEQIKVKIQRYGKEPKQGVGYLEDGTMVVVNGGGDSLGETIDAQVLSVKHTTAGRMIFCNTLGNRFDQGNSMAAQDDFSYHHSGDHEEQ